MRFCAWKNHRWILIFLSLIWFYSSIVIRTPSSDFNTPSSQIAYRTSGRLHLVVRAILKCYEELIRIMGLVWSNLDTLIWLQVERSNKADTLIRSSRRIAVAYWGFSCKFHKSQNCRFLLLWLELHVLRMSRAQTRINGDQQCGSSKMRMFFHNFCTDRLTHAGSILTT